MPELGRKETVGIGIESASGTGVAPQTFIPVTDWGVDVNPEYVDDNSSLGRIEDSIDSYKVSSKADCNIGGIVYDKAFGYLLLAALGSVSSADSGDASGTVYKHTYTVKNDSAHPSLSLEFEGADYDQKIVYAMLESLELNAVINDVFKYSASFKAQGEAATAGSPAYTQENVFVPKNMSVKLADTQAGLDAASAISVRSLRLTITKNVTQEYALGDEDPTALYNQGFMIEGDLEMILSNDTYKDYVRDGDQKALRLNVLNDDVTIGTADKPEFNIDLNLVTLKNWDMSTDIDGIKSQTIGFKAHYKPADSKMVQAELTNLQASYVHA